MPCGERQVTIRCSSPADGDFHIDRDRGALLARRRAFESGVWTQLDEVHGVTAYVVNQPGEHDFAVGDALVSRLDGVVLATWVADCAAVVFAGDGGVFGAAHAGWRGARDGVLEATVDAMRANGAGNVTALLVSSIGHCCYEFHDPEMAQMVDRCGEGVVRSTTWGAPSLSMPDVVGTLLAKVGVSMSDVSVCTRCHPERAYSHRRGDSARHVVTARLQ